MQEQERPLTIDAPDPRGALDQAAQLILEALDTFVYSPASDPFVFGSLSQAALGRHERARGPDRLRLGSRQCAPRNRPNSTTARGRSSAACC